MNLSTFRLAFALGATSLFFMGCAAPAPSTPEPAAASPPSPAAARQSPDLSPSPLPQTQPTISLTPATPTSTPAQTPQATPAADGEALLLSLFPQTIRGQPVTVEVMRLEQMMEEFGTEPGDEQDDLALLADFFQGLGVAPSTVTIASAYVELEQDFAAISAVHAPGVPMPVLLEGMTAITERLLAGFEEGTPHTREATVAGKQVTVVELGDIAPEDERAYFYAAGDVLFEVDALTEVAEIVLTELP